MRRPSYRIGSNVLPDSDYLAHGYRVDFCDRLVRG